MEHTPGPRSMSLLDRDVSSPGTFYIRSADKSIVAQTVSAESTHHALGNARLIAAAPSLRAINAGLLEALEWVAGSHEVMTPDGAMFGVSWEVMNEVLAAVRKARRQEKEERT